MPESQLDMYIKNQNKLLEKYENKIIAVQDGQFLGEYPNELAAYRDMLARNIQQGTYMIVKCTPGNSAYTTYLANWFPIESKDVIEA